MAATRKTKTRRKRRGGPNAAGIRRRQLLLDAAERLLSAQAFDDVSYAAIAREADLPLTSCYHFYDNKLSLVAALEQRLSDGYRALLTGEDAPWDDMKRWQDAIDLFLAITLDYQNEHPAAREIWFSGNLPPSVIRTANERDHVLAAILEEIICSRFAIPDFPRRQLVFYIAWEIGEQVMTAACRTEGQLEFIADEAAKAMKAYLLLYLPARCRRLKR